MLKLVSIMLIFAAGFVLSADYAAEYKRKNKFTEGLICAFEFMAGEIVFEQKFLGESLKQKSVYGGEAEEFLNMTGKLMESKVSAKEAFSAAEKKCFKGSAAVREILAQYFSEAGMGDTDTEHKKLLSLTEKLKKAEELEREYIENTVTQNRKIIIAASVLICVLII